MPGGLSERVYVEPQPGRVVLRFGGAGGVFSFPMSPAEVDELIEEIAPYGTPEGADAKRQAPRAPLDDSPPSAPAAARRNVVRGTGAAAVVSLIDEGLIEPGEELTMRTGGETHRARVLADGSFSVGGRVERSPTEAACVVAQSRRSGWRMWTTASGETLEELRWKLRASSFSDGQDREIVQAWVAETVERRFSPGREHPNIFDGFCDANGFDPDQARKVLGEWFQWCSANKWTRSAQPAPAS